METNGKWIARKNTWGNWDVIKDNECATYGKKIDKPTAKRYADALNAFDADVDLIDMEMVMRDAAYHLEQYPAGKVVYAKLIRALRDAADKLALVTAVNPLTEGDSV